MTEIRALLPTIGREQLLRSRMERIILGRELRKAACRERQVRSGRHVLRPPRRGRRALERRRVHAIGGTPGREFACLVAACRAFWMRAVVGLVFLAAFVFHLSMDQPQRLAPSGRSSASAASCSASRRRPLGRLAVSPARDPRGSGSQQHSTQATNAGRAPFVSRILAKGNGQTIVPT
jgi:hypothetical protein